QWQPQLDFDDTRLLGPFSIWEARIGLGEVLAQLSEASGAAMTTAPEQAALDVSLFVEKGTVSGVMLSLSELYAGHWCYRRGESPTERSYYLVPAHLPRPRGPNDWRERQRAAWKVEHAPWREERERALEEHRKALSLTPEEVLARYEEGDPWLCVNVLNERTRPLVEYACSLEGDELDELLTYGRIDYRPLRRFPEQVQTYLVGQIRAEHEGYGLYRDEYLFHGPCRFDTFEDRLTNTSVSVEWRQSALVLQAYVPDTGMTNWRAMTSESVRDTEPEARARSRLLSMGYGDTSPERKQELRQQISEWYQSRPDPREIMSDPSKWGEHSDLRKLGLVEDPDTGNPRLSLPFSLAEMEGERLVGADLLEEVAKQCELAVVADYDDLSYPVCLGQVRLLPETSTLGDILARVRGLQGGGISYNFLGKYLLVSFPGSRVLPEPELAPELEKALRETFAPGASVPLERAAALLGQLGEVNLARVSTAVLGLSFRSDSETFTKLNAARSYGRFTAEQRRRLLQGEMLSFSELSDDVQQQVHEGARANWRQWLTLDEMANTVIRGELTEGDDGEPCLRLVYEYNFGDSPRDRLVSHLPLVLRMPARESEPEVAPSGTGSTGD
ncbi:MAG: hypothetical protein JXA57_02875, partial [Armatimonadetes bacterium]|nr:hypothetical protein [Armatimonadota bacterium]